MRTENHFDVIIVGAGPAGLGCALALQACGIEKMTILERGRIGSSFAKWPKQMRLITPSFHSNPFQQPDLNAIHPKTSPADFANTEHPSGEQYALYLQALAGFYQLPVQEETLVRKIIPMDDQFAVQTSQGNYTARFVIWAVGEFQTPHDGEIKGAHLCLHNSKVTDWKTLQGDVFNVIGGYESGIDAAIHLAWANKEVHLLSRGEPWQSTDSDPSRALSPFTRDRLKDALRNAPGSLRFYKNADIQKVSKIKSTYYLFDGDEQPYESPTPPILCTGFQSALARVRHLFHENENGIIFSEAADESTRHPGLFYSGPSLAHRDSLFCFIYKFRSRFGIIARAIAERMNIAWEKPLQTWRDYGFMIDNLSCCTDCKCTVTTEEEAPAEVADFQESKTSTTATYA